jgi:hypothetical protein
MKSFLRRLNTLWLRATLLVVGFASTVALGAGGFGLTATAGAACGPPITSPDDAVSCGFASSQTQLVGYLGDAVLLVLAIVGLAVGVRMLVRWVKRAAAT